MSKDLEAQLEKQAAPSKRQRRRSNPREEAQGVRQRPRGQLLAPREPGRAPEGHVVLEVRVITTERLDCWIYVLANLLAVPAYGLKVWSKLVDVLQTEEDLAYLQACTDMPIRSCTYLLTY